MRGRDQNYAAAETLPIAGIVTVATYALGLLGVLLGRFALDFSWVTAILLFFPVYGLACGLVNNESQRIMASACALLMFPVMVACGPAVVARIQASLPAQSPSVATAGIVLDACVMATLFCILTGVSRLLSSCFGSWRLPNRAHGAAVRTLLIFTSAVAFYGGIRLMRLACVRLSLGGGLAVITSLVFAAAFVMLVRRILRFGFAAADQKPMARGGETAAPNVRLASRPNVRLVDVAGMDEVKRQIRLRLIDPLRDAVRARQYGIVVGGGMLLYGPPGTGKTFIAKAVAGELGLPFYAITAADVFGRYVGESERNIRTIFADIRKNSLSVVFIDELETLFPKRTGDMEESTRKVISVLLQELDGIDSGRNPVLLLGATNVPWMIDEAFMRPGRFDVRVFVGLPDYEARRQMFRAAFAKGSVPHVSGLTAYLASRTENYSGADINGVMAKIRQTAYERRLPAYTTLLADEILAQTAPSATGDILDSIREWEATSVGEKAKNVIRGGTHVAERPATRLCDVAGMEDVKEQVRLRLIEPMTHQTLAGKYGLTVGGGMLLYGPPGTGKTFFARAVAGELELPFYMVTAADIFGKYVGESERNVRKLFNDIRKNPLSVVFIDELETIFPKRTQEVHESTRKVISILLQELDGIDRSKNPILLLGATNVPWLIDEAFLRPGRFDVKVYVGLPDFDARRQMLIAAFDEGDIPHEPGLTAHIAELTEGYSGADLRGVMARMRQQAFDRRLQLYTYGFADEVLATSSPTTSAETVRRIREWGKT